MDESKLSIKLNPELILKLILEIRPKLTKLRRELLSSKTEKYMRCTYYRPEYCKYCWEHYTSSIREKISRSEFELLEFELTRNNHEKLIRNLEKLVKKLKTESHFEDEYFNEVERLIVNNKQHKLLPFWPLSRLSAIDLGLELIDPISELISELKQNA